MPVGNASRRIIEMENCGIYKKKNYGHGKIAEASNYHIEKRTLINMLENGLIVKRHRQFWKNSCQRNYR